MNTKQQQKIEELIDAGHQLHMRGMVPATSGNLSARLDAESIVITRSGRHKGRLTAEDFMRVDMQGKAIDEGRPSAETLLHCQIYSVYEEAGCVLHPHSVNATVLSRLLTGHLELHGYELLKAFPQIESHLQEVTVPVFENDQDIARLSEEVAGTLQQGIPGYLLRGHGFYTWGVSTQDALRHVEALEFLFECELGMRRKIS